MADLILVAGESGTGKSTAVKDLNPETTFMLNCVDKRLPFKGSSGAYTVEKKNYFATTNPRDILGTINWVDTKAPHITTLIIDDLGYVPMKELFARSDEKGYDKFTTIAKNMVEIMDRCREARSNLTIFITFHTETSFSDQNGTHISLKLPGKMISEKYVPEGVVSIFLHSVVVYDKDKSPSYKFVTNRTMLKNASGISVEIPAKSPDGMFDSLFIDNNYAEILSKKQAYYGE